MEFDSVTITVVLSDLGVTSESHQGNQYGRNCRKTVRDDDRRGARYLSPNHVSSGQWGETRRRWVSTERLASIPQTFEFTPEKLRHGAAHLTIGTPDRSSARIF